MLYGGSNINNSHSGWSKNNKKRLRWRERLKDKYSSKRSKKKNYWNEQIEDENVFLSQIDKTFDNYTKTRILSYCNVFYVEFLLNRVLKVLTSKQPELIYDYKKYVFNIDKYEYALRKRKYVIPMYFLRPFYS